jgi:hypothetical protein
MLTAIESIDPMATARPAPASTHHFFTFGTARRRYRLAMTAGLGDEYLLWRHLLEDGENTTLYALRFPRATTRVRVVHFPDMQRLDVWGATTGEPEAIVGGFFLRDPYRPLGELWVDGRAVEHEAIPEQWARHRAGVACHDGEVQLGYREDLPARPAGDLVQAGPLLVAGGRIVYDGETDEEGFSAGAGQFDSDITDGRYPRAALGVSEDGYVAVACDGRRSGVDAGLTMLELADVMLKLGSEDAINLDGGGSTTLVHRGHLLNRPYSNQDQPAPESRPIISALAFAPRGT